MLKQLALAFGFVVVASVAIAQPYPQATFAPQPPINGVGAGFDPSNQAANFNYLVSAINNILSPLIPYTPNATSFISLTPGAYGDSPYLIPFGAQANIGVKVAPKGNGNIVLFPAVGSTYSTGIIKVGNLASWLPVQGIANCPAVVAGKAQIGMADHITGYLMIEDWLDRKHGMPGC